MKTVAATLQVARSNLIERRDGSRPQRAPQNRAGDFDLVADIRRLVDQRPTYGYRRIAALLKRERRSAGRQPVNAKRIFRLMKKHGLLLQAGYMIAPASQDVRARLTAAGAVRGVPIDGLIRL